MKSLTHQKMKWKVWRTKRWNENCSMKSLTHQKIKCKLINEKFDAPVRETLFPWSCCQWRLVSYRFACKINPFNSCNFFWKVYKLGLFFWLVIVCLYLQKLAPPPAVKEVQPRRQETFYNRVNKEESFQKFQKYTSQRSWENCSVIWIEE